MKTLITLSFALLMAGVVQAQDFSGLEKSPMDMIKYPTSNSETNKIARVIYSRPQLKGRKLSSLIPEGKIWRMGANEATELTLYKALKLDGKEIPAGSYTLYAMASGNEITLIVNKAVHVWGAYSYDQDKDIARVTVPWKAGAKNVEAFSMRFAKAKAGLDLHLGWGDRRAKLTFSN